MSQTSRIIVLHWERGLELFPACNGPSEPLEEHKEVLTRMIHAMDSKNVRIGYGMVK